jgi:hypothetical protein
MEQPNRQNNLPMESRTTHKINRMDQHSQKSIPSKSGRNRSISSTRNRSGKVVQGTHDLNDITGEGFSLLDDTELWWEKQDLLWACHASRTKDRVNHDGSFRPHQSGAISSTFTSDWYLREGECRDKMG